ncbi:MAG: hypothetical protein NT002_06615 [candidate division Zixibacteria bacterium]|nr:hypothetical protein [candidate division Zixibacteria bacterium]
MNSGEDCPPLEKKRTFFNDFWAYLILFIFIIGYNYFFLGQGFAPSLDEGFLQSLGQRIVNGEIPYGDFYLLRTPLSIYIQAGLIWVFGHSYTLFAARIWLAIETMLIVIFLSMFYRRFVRPLELLLLLFITYIIATLLLNFPWYSYDALFFAVLALLFFDRRRYFLSGAAIFMAGMAKQNYMMMLPLIILLSLVINHVAKEIKIITYDAARRMIIGFFAPFLLYMLYLSITGTIAAFYRDVVILPGQCSSVGIVFALFQDNPKAFLWSLPFMISMALIFGGRRWRLPLIAVALGVFALLGEILIKNVYSFVYFIVYLNYLAVLLLVKEYVVGMDDAGKEMAAKIIPLFALALIVQYLSGFNYSGLIYAYMGALVALPFTYVILRDCIQMRLRKAVVVLLFLAILVLGQYHKYRYVYNDAPRSNLNVEFVSPRLRHIKSTPEKVKSLESVIAAIKANSSEKDHIFIFPSFSSLYYLTGRRNPTPIEWYCEAEYNEEMLMESMKAVEAKRPRLVIVTHLDIPVHLNNILINYYRELPPIGLFRLFELKT